jgi:polyphosphate kinase
VNGSPRYINRELSWLEFNARVLHEAARRENPLLERLKFLAIFESNLDEFFMVRVSGLIEQVEQGIHPETPDGFAPAEQVRMIREEVQRLRERAARLWNERLAPQAARRGFRLRKFSELDPAARERLSVQFRDEVFPVCTPLPLEEGASFPFISNRSLNLAVELREGSETRWARIKAPSVAPRLIRTGSKGDFILLEEVIGAHLEVFFPGLEIVGWSLFRVIRDADVEIKELDAADLIGMVEESLRKRRFGHPVMLEVQASMPPTARQVLLAGLDLGSEAMVEAEGLLGFEVFWESAGLRLSRGPARFRAHQPIASPRLESSRTLFEAIRRQDVLLHHPFDSFAAVEAFVGAASEDPQTLAIKQTLYRVGSDSAIVESLLRGAEAGRQVAAMVELKARFDESNNLIWSRALERAGVHVAYGFREMKVHAKLSLIVRKEPDGIRSYAHIGTGNYNPKTARLYTDLGLFTSDPDICLDVMELFNVLTGLSRQQEFRKLLVAPFSLRDRIIQLIEEEAFQASQGREARIIFKVNSLVDPEVIEALYAASGAGVEIDLIVRGICCLRPGVKGMSSRIRVRSVIGRFLEHSRVYWFSGGGDPKCYIGSADIMRRNLDRRIETLAPIESPELLVWIRSVLLDAYLRDTAGTWKMSGSGRYRRAARPRGQGHFCAQERLMELSPTELLAGSDEDQS